MQNGPPDDHRMFPGIGNGQPRYLHNNIISRYTDLDMDAKK